MYMYIYTYMHKETIEQSIDGHCWTIKEWWCEWTNLMFNCTTFDIKKKRDAIIVGSRSSYLWDCDLWCVCLVVAADFPSPAQSSNRLPFIRHFPISLCFTDFY